MYVEDTRLFRLGVSIVAFGTVWWLSARVGVWPNGPLTAPSALLLLLCLAGAERLYGVVLGIAAIYLWRGRQRFPSHRSP
jgi:hypothetical protein